MTVGTCDGGHNWRLVVVYRGLHCPLCKKYLAQLQEMEADLNPAGANVVAVPSDPEDKAQAMADEKGLSIAMGYGLSVEQMKDLCLYVSDPRSPTRRTVHFLNLACFW
nr:redoxin domain-containing protein [Tateyamaria omphalii]